VVAATDTGAPTAAVNAASASARRGPIRGVCPTTCTATFPGRKPAAATNRTVSVSSAMPDAPDHRGSEVPKTEPRSPSPAADSSASQAACAATSPSEWPAHPSAPYQSSPASQHGRPAASGCTSTPMPTRTRGTVSGQNAEMPTAAAVVLAGGSGTRLGAEGNKVYLPLAGQPLLAWSLEAFARAPGIGRLVLVTRPADRGQAEQAARGVDRPVEIVDGGVARHDSEWAALRLLAPAIEAGEIDVVAIHDGARPLVTQRLIADALAAAREHGAAVPGVPLSGVAGRDLTPVGGTLVRVQTPQAFRADLLLAAYTKADADCFTGTDTAACVERYAGIPVHCIPGDPRNVKVTYRPDLALAERLLRP
jgi:2-C-methyl-D-erythritol 4-phosphate cytidylyltransferase